MNQHEHHGDHPQRPRALERSSDTPRGSSRPSGGTCVSGVNRNTSARATTATITMNTNDIPPAADDRGERPRWAARAASTAGTSPATRLIERARCAERRQVSHGREHRRDRRPPRPAHWRCAPPMRSGSVGATTHAAAARGEDGQAEQHREPAGRADPKAGRRPARRTAVGRAYALARSPTLETGSLSSAATAGSIAATM